MGFTECCSFASNVTCCNCSAATAVVINCAVWILLPFDVSVVSPAILWITSASGHTLHNGCHTHFMTKKNVCKRSGLHQKYWLLGKDKYWHEFCCIYGRTWLLALIYQIARWITLRWLLYLNCENNKRVKEVRQEITRVASSILHNYKLTLLTVVHVKLRKKN